MATNTKKKGTAPALTEADARAATDTDLVEVTLPKDRKWVPEGSNKAVTYPAGLQRIPRKMAEGLGLVDSDGKAVERPATQATPQGGEQNSAAVTDLYAIVDTLGKRIQELEAFVELLGTDPSKANPDKEPADTTKKDGK